VAVALRGYVASDRMPPGEQLLCMTGAHWPAYAWAFPVGDGTANVGYGELLQNGSGPSRAAMVQRLRRLLRMVLPDGEIGSLRGHRLPLSPGRPPVARGRVLFAGDAASLINPITGEGIYYAVLSGALAGAAAFAARPDDAYRRALARQLAGHFRHTDILAELGRFPVLINAAVAAAGRSQRVFDDIVELGLGHGGMTARVAAALAREALRA
jgi:flavin-dependent dehydrogenase